MQLKTVSHCESKHLGIVDWVITDGKEVKAKISFERDTDWSLAVKMSVMQSFWTSRRKFCVKIVLALGEGGEQNPVLMFSCERRKTTEYHKVTGTIT